MTLNRFLQFIAIGLCMWAAVIKITWSAIQWSMKFC